MRTEEGIRRGRSEEKWFENAFKHMGKKKDSQAERPARLCGEATSNKRHVALFLLPLDIGDSSRHKAQKKRGTRAGQEGPRKREKKGQGEKTAARSCGKARELSESELSTDKEGKSCPTRGD